MSPVSGWSRLHRTAAPDRESQPRQYVRTPNCDPAPHRTTRRRTLPTLQGICEPSLRRDGTAVTGSPPRIASTPGSPSLPRAASRRTGTTMSPTRRGAPSSVPSRDASDPRRAARNATMPLDGTGSKAVTITWRARAFLATEVDASWTAPRTGIRPGKKQRMTRRMSDPEIAATVDVLRRVPAAISAWSEGAAGDGARRRDDGRRADPPPDPDR